LILPIEDQIKFFLQHHGIKNTQVGTSKLGDVTTGQCYQDIIKEQANVVSLLCNIDGAQCFESSKFGFWPFMGVINEASYEIRRSCVILLGLWSGDMKPPMEAFVKPCVEELEKLMRSGIMHDGIKYTFKVTIFSTDTIARPLLRNTTQFNGNFGCDFCLHPGRIKFTGYYVYVF
jgi:hypothetical protein